MLGQIHNGSQETFDSQYIRAEWNLEDCLFQLPYFTK